MNISKAVLIEANGELELPRDLTDVFQEIDSAISGIRVRKVGSQFVEVNDRGLVTRRGAEAAQEYPIVVESLLVQGKAATVVFRP